MLYEVFGESGWKLYVCVVEFAPLNVLTILEIGVFGVLDQRQVADSSVLRESVVAVVVYGRVVAGRPRERTGALVSPITVTVTSSDEERSPSVAVRRSMYVPG